MGTSWVGVGEHGFWLNDGHCELLLHFLANEVDRHPAPAPWLVKAGKHWRSWSLAKATGCIDFGLDQFMTTPDRAQELLTLVKAIRRSIRKRRTPLSEEVGRRPNSTLPYQFVGDIPRDWFLQAIDALSDLLTGKLKTTAATSPRLPVH